jgi:hypothetical protein
MCQYLYTKIISPVEVYTRACAYLIFMSYVIWVHTMTTDTRTFCIFIPVWSKHNYFKLIRFHKMYSWLRRSRHYPDKVIQIRCWTSETRTFHIYDILWIVIIRMRGLSLKQNIINMLIDKSTNFHYKYPLYWLYTTDNSFNGY